MSEGPSDPDLQAFADLPDTGKFAIDHVNDPDLIATHGAVRAIGKWATNQHRKQAKVESLGFKLLVAVVSGAMAMVASTVGAAVYVGVRLERLEEVKRRVDRLEASVYGFDAVTHATED